MLIKICGLTRREDVEVAVASGATAVGFICWPRSPRYVEADRLADLTSVVPPGVLRVGVFVNEAVDTVNAVASRANLDVAQLHGDESGAYARRVSARVWRTSRKDEDASVQGWPDDTLLLLDVNDPVARGGTGVRVDWQWAAQVSRRSPIVLAGGLTAENVAEAVRTVRPFGVDVSSGVELAPGIKDHDKVRRFVLEAGAAARQYVDVEREREDRGRGR